jgi:hypothetical protein
MKNVETIIWQSKLFPGMMLTKEHLEILKYAYPNIEKIEPELRKAEAWLHANPQRVPKSNWKAFINSWMRIASEMIKNKNLKCGGTAHYGDAARLTRHDPALLKDIIEKYKPEENQS